MNRLVIVPEQKFEPLTLDLERRLITIAREELHGERLTDLFTAEGALLHRAIHDIHGSREIQIWGKSSTGFVVVWTSKGTSDPAVAAVTAEPGRGLIYRVFESERPEIEESTHLNASDWTNLEQKRGAKLLSMAAHPVMIFGHRVAVLTLVRFADTHTPQKLDQTDLEDAAAAASLLIRLVEDRLIRACLGLEQK